MILGQETAASLEERSRLKAERDHVLNEINEQKRIVQEKEEEKRMIEAALAKARAERDDHSNGIKKRESGGQFTYHHFSIYPGLLSFTKFETIFLQLGVYIYIQEKEYILLRLQIRELNTYSLDCEIFIVAFQCEVELVRKCE